MEQAVLKQSESLLSCFAPTAEANLIRIKESYYSSLRDNGAWTDLSQPEMQALISRISTGEAWREVLFDYTSKHNNTWLERITLSQARHLFLELFDFSQIKRVLDIGSGWGQLTRPLAEKADFVMSVEPNSERLEVNYAICEQEQIKNVCFLHADVLNLPLREEFFDFALMCGVYEWLGTSTEGKVADIQEASLRRLGKLLHSGGTLAIAIENRTGLKYLFGERDDHSQLRHLSYLPFEEAASRYLELTKSELRARTYDLFELKSLLRNGFDDIQFHLAFPDYKLPQLLVPAESREVMKHIIDAIGLPPEHDGCNGDVSKNIEVLDRVYRGLNNLGITTFIAPSFIISARKQG